MVPAPAYLQSSHSQAQTQTQTRPQTPSSQDGILRLKASLKDSKATTAANTPAASSSSRLSGPLRLTNAFERRGIHHFNHSPAIGTEFEKGQLDLAELLQRPEGDEEADELIRELAVMSECEHFYISPCYSIPLCLSYLEKRMSEWRRSPERRSHAPVSFHADNVQEAPGGRRIIALDYKHIAALYHNHTPSSSPMLHLDRSSFRPSFQKVNGRVGQLSSPSSTWKKGTRHVPACLSAKEEARWRGPIIHSFTTSYSMYPNFTNADCHHSCHSPDGLPTLQSRTAV